MSNNKSQQNPNLAHQKNLRSQDRKRQPDASNPQLQMKKKKNRPKVKFVEEKLDFSDKLKDIEREFSRENRELSNEEDELYGPKMLERIKASLKKCTYIEPNIEETQARDHFELRTVGPTAQISINFRPAINLITTATRQAIANLPLMFQNYQIDPLYSRILTYAICSKIAKSSLKSNSNYTSELVKYFCGLQDLRIPNVLHSFFDHIGDFKSELGMFVLEDKNKLIADLLNDTTISLFNKSTFDVLLAMFGGKTFRYAGVSVSISCDPMKVFKSLQQPRFREIAVQQIYPQRVGVLEATTFLVQNRNFIITDAEHLAALRGIGIEPFDLKPIQDIVKCDLAIWDSFLSILPIQIQKSFGDYHPIKSGSSAQLCFTDLDAIKSQYRVPPDMAFIALMLQIKSVHSYSGFAQTTFSDIPSSFFVKELK